MVKRFLLSPFDEAQNVIKYLYVHDHLSQVSFLLQLIGAGCAFTSQTDCKCLISGIASKAIIFTIFFFSSQFLIGVYDPDQSGSGLFDILKGGTERFLTNIKDTSSKVIQSVAR